MIREKVDRTKKYTFLYRYRDEILEKSDDITSQIKNIKDCSLEDGMFIGNGLIGGYFNLYIKTENKKWSFQQALYGERVRVDNITDKVYGIYFKTTVDAISFINLENTL